MTRLNLGYLAAAALGIGIGGYFGGLAGKLDSKPSPSVTRSSAPSTKKACTLTATMPSLETPDAVRCTDNGSAKVVINVWDQNHLDSEVQTQIGRTIEEIVEKWGVHVVAREGNHELGNQEIIGDPNQEGLYHDYLLPLQFQGVRLFGVEHLDPFYNYQHNLNALETRFYDLRKQANRQADLCYQRSPSEACYQVEHFKELQQLVSEVQSEVERLNYTLKLSEDLRDFVSLGPILWNLSDYISIPLRSYAAVDGIVGILNSLPDSQVILSYGSAHEEQINGYLDHLKISHIDVFLDGNLFDTLTAALRENPLYTFSLSGVEDYRKQVAGKNFE